jgi:type VI protein secretion system component VasF
MSAAQGRRFADGVRTMDDEAQFLLQVAEGLRGLTARTLVARRAYDRVADELTQLAREAEASNRSQDDPTGEGPATGTPRAGD